MEYAPSLRDCLFYLEVYESKESQIQNRKTKVEEGYPYYFPSIQEENSNELKNIKEQTSLGDFLRIFHG